MLIGITFNVMQNMMNNKLKEIREIIENINGSIAANNGMIASFMYGQNGSQGYQVH
jgi:hypothetical protein